MKGVVFVALAEMMQEKFGHKCWNEIIANTELESKGVYTTAASYNDQEALNLLSSISVKIDKTIPDTLKIFGLYLMKYFIKKYPHFFEKKTFFEFLLSINDIVHVEIKKIAPDSTPPSVLAKVIEPDKKIQVSYISKRKLCPLAIGLIKGASHHYDVKVEIEHIACMHDGNESCEFIVTVV